MSILSRLFGSDKVIDAGIKGIDKAFYTKEERAEDEIKKINARLLFLKAYEPFKVAQRFLALVLAIPFVSIHVITTIAWLTSLFVFRENIEAYEFVVAQIAEVANTNNLTLGEPLLWVVVFYFAGGASEGVVNKALGFRKK